MASSYAQHAKDQAERSRQRSRLGRDIYPIPVIKSPHTRLACRDDLKGFCVSYLPNWFTKPFGTAHLTLIDSLQRILREGGRQAVAMPRGSGKSTLVAAAILWALAYGHRRFVVVVGASSKAAKKFISLLSSTLATPGTPLSGDFPEMVYPIQALGGSVVQCRGQHYRGGLTRISLTAEQIVLPTIPCSPSSGSRLVALGIGSAIRGLSAEAPDGSILRPDCVIIDDAQSDADAISPARVEKLSGLINGVIKGLARSGERLAQVSTCTVVCPDDLADKMLTDPLWNGLRTAALTSMPSNLDLWREYKDLLFERGEAEAKQFYLDHLAEMNAGAEASWKEDFDPTYYVDAVEYNMRLWCEDERSFWAERQNAPQRPSGLADILTPSEIARKLSYIPHYSTHEHTHKITAAIDVHDDLLYFAVVGLNADYTASVLDYGSYPKQNRPYFYRGSGITSLTNIYGGEPASNVLQGLTELIKQLAEHRYHVEGGGELRIERILIDSGWRAEIVYEAIRRSGVSSVAIAVKGISIRAAQKPMNDWAKKPGRVRGWHCIEERVEGKSLLLIDVNYWKTRLHEAFATPAGKPGEMTLFGDDAQRHRMLADQLCSEAPRIEEGANTVVVWQIKPSAENHLLDCCTYSYAAGVTLGLKPVDCVM